MKDITFSNSVTIEHPPSSRFRRTGACAVAATDRPAHRSLGEGEFHYVQVGSVLSKSNASGNLIEKHYQNAFGLRQADWETALPDGKREGWAHSETLFRVVG